MNEILCTPALTQTAALEIEEASAPAESWAADAFPFQRQYMLSFLHLPTQYMLLAGPFGKTALKDIRRHFRDSLWAALHTDGFDSATIDSLMAKISNLDLSQAELEPQHRAIFATVHHAFTLYAKAAGDALDLDEFIVPIRHTKSHGLAAVSPRDTFELWAQSIAGED